MIIFLGLLMTIVTAKNQREALRQGIVRMVKRGERYDKPEVAPAEGGNANDDGEGSEQIDRCERTHPAVL